MWEAEMATIIIDSLTFTKITAGDKCCEFPC